MVVTMRRVFLLGLIAAALLSAGPRVRLGGVVVNAGYSRGGYWGPGWWGPGYWGPGYWGPAGWGMWDPFWYGPMMHPGYLRGWAQGPGMGEVKLKSVPEDAIVLLDGAYAGEAKKLKSIWLEPGVYNLEVRDDQAGSFERKIYVLSGKTLQLQAQLKKKEGR